MDDDIPIRDMLEEVLEKEGYQVSRAYSGTEALLLLDARRPDLVLLDLMLPGLSGEEVLPRMRGIPVIVVSAKGDVDGKVGLLLGGAVDYVTKPFAVKELLARIGRRPAAGGPGGRGADRRRSAAGHGGAQRDGGRPGRPADQDGICRAEAADAESVAGVGQIGAAGSHSGGHAGLHGKLAENACQPFAPQAAGGGGQGVHRGRLGHRLPADGGVKSIPFLYAFLYRFLYGCLLQ